MSFLFDFAGLSPEEVFFHVCFLFCAVVGLFRIASVKIRFWIFVYRTFIRSPYNLRKLYGVGGWACVTGATDGIGQSISFELAKRGVNVLLVSRTESKLKETQSAILAKYPEVQVAILQVDYSKDVDYEKVKQALVSLPGPLVMLVNNVGVSYDFPMFFSELPADRVQDMIRLNIDSTTNMTRLALELFQLKPGKGRKGAIVNMGSAAGLTSNPLLTQYSAAKAYVQKFSEGLAVEMKPLGVDVQVHTPFFIVSKMSKIRGASMFVPSSDQYAKSVVNAIGCGEVVVNPFPMHTLLGFLIKNVFPNRLREMFTRSHHVSIRKRGMKKMSAKKE